LALTNYYNLIFIIVDLLQYNTVEQCGQLNPSLSAHLTSYLDSFFSLSNATPRPQEPLELRHIGIFFLSPLFSTRPLSHFQTHTTLLLIHLHRISSTFINKRNATTGFHQIWICSSTVHSLSLYSCSHVVSKHVFGTTKKRTTTYVHKWPRLGPSVVVKVNVVTSRTSRFLL
jgi:hypothetical protein